MKFLTLEERRRIEELLKEGLSFLNISRMIERSRNAIIYEVRRGGGRQDYKAEEAHESTKVRMREGRVKSTATFKSNFSVCKGTYQGLNERIEHLEMQIEILITVLKEKKTDGSKD